MHRDVEPKHLGWAPGNRLALIDFSSAVALHGSDGQGRTRSTSRSASRSQTDGYRGGWLQHCCIHTVGPNLHFSSHRIPLKWLAVGWLHAHACQPTLQPTPKYEVPHTLPTALVAGKGAHTIFKCMENVMFEGRGAGRAGVAARNSTWRCTVPVAGTLVFAAPAVLAALARGESCDAHAAHDLVRQHTAAAAQPHVLLVARRLIACSEPVCAVHLPCARHQFTNHSTDPQLTMCTVFFV